MKLVLCLLGFVILSAGCLKSDTGCSLQQSNVVAPTSEQAELEQYLDANGITATKHSSGFYYNILEPGTGASPGLCSTVQIAYTGRRTDNFQFDANTNLQIQLGQLIEGWRKGLPLLKKGGRIMLYIPPSLGYGARDILDQQGNVIIPKNSHLIFDVTLINLQD